MLLVIKKNKKKNEIFTNLIFRFKTCGHYTGLTCKLFFSSLLDMLFFLVKLSKIKEFELGLIKTSLVSKEDDYKFRISDLVDKSFLKKKNRKKKKYKILVVFGDCKAWLFMT